MIRLLSFVPICLTVIDSNTAGQKFHSAPVRQSGDRKNATSTAGVLDASLHVQFHELNVPGIGRIWTRAYGPRKGIVQIPSTTFRVNPGDLFRVRFFNELDRKNSPDIAKFDRKIKLKPDSDDIAQKVMHEINIPHNPNNTNLHVHGLHVDPWRDDVTIVVIPPDEDPKKYSHDVSDQSVKKGSWIYEYRLPRDHLPGTHWYHAHKHGSTALHVENGMAGTIIIQEPKPLGGIGTKRDRVMMLQGLLNYGLQPGKGNTKGDKPGPGKVRRSHPLPTINGVANGTLEIPRNNQIERWRLVNATANHMNFGYFWLGRDTGDGKTFESVPIYAIAVDGVTLPKLQRITAATPLMLAPGNRADVVVQLPYSKHDYVLFKNLPSDVTVRGLDSRMTKLLRLGPRLNPYLFVDLDKDGGSYTKNLTWWKTPSGTAKQVPLVPLLRIRPKRVGTSVLADVAFDETPGPGRVGWQPAPHPGGGGVMAARLLTVKVTSPLPAGAPAQRATSIDPAPYSPMGRLKPVPGYVSPIRPQDVLQSRAAVFDLSGVHLDYKGEGGANIRQFTLNGRQFAVHDYIGNPNASKMIAKPLDKTLLPVIAGVKPKLTIGQTDVTGTWANQNAWVNPGYYQPLVNAPVREANGAVRNCLSYATTPRRPNIGSVTGYPQVSLVNPSFPKARSIAGIPGAPVATTAEEWVLINNSDIGHPFHIHINPFFITEIGQLTNTGGKWHLNKITYRNGRRVVSNGATTTNPMAWMVGTWWDVVLIPPHGYVKFRYWFNVPKQSADSRTVAENVNRVGAWVYHCHILRHEDRGMMQVVKTQKLRAKKAIAP